MKLETYVDNGGRYHWRLMDADGTAVAASTAVYATRDQAHSAAQQVHADAASMTIEGT
jgi:uncharacterized protein YegP (UPF0339 family)